MRENGWLRKLWRAFNYFSDAMVAVEFLFLMFLIGLAVVAGGHALYDRAVGPTEANEPETVTPTIGHP